MLHALTSCVVSIALLAAQDPGERCAEALLRGDRAAAMAAAASADEPALRARLQAALSPLPQRAGALLAVARGFPASGEADRALLAAAAAILAQRDHGRAVPGLMEWLAFEDDDGADQGEDSGGEDEAEPVAPTTTVAQLWRGLEDRRRDGGDAAMLAEVERLLQVASVSRYGFEPVRVLPVANWPLPERREDLVLRCWRRAPGRLDWQEIERLGRPDVQHRLVAPDNVSGSGAEPTLAVPGLPAGDWLVELASTATRWRALRAIEVSDLDVLALVDHDVLAVGAWRGDRPLGEGEWRWTGAGGLDAAGAIHAGTSVARAPQRTADGYEYRQSVLQVRGDGQPGRVRLTGWWSWQRRQRPADAWVAHLMLDRPVHRRGDRVQGRVLLRRSRYEGDGIDTVAATGIAGDQPVRVRAFAGSAVEQRVEGRTDEHGVFAFELRVPSDAAGGAQRVVVEVPGGDEPVQALDESASLVAEFSRAPLLGGCEGPASAKLGGGPLEIAVRARWASGSPAAGIHVAAAVTHWPSGGSSGRYENHRLRTDAEGRARVAIDTTHLSAGDLNVVFTLAAPDGQPLVLRHALRLLGVDATAPRHPWWWGPGSVRVEGPDEGVVGVPCRLVVHGPANAHVLLVCGRGDGARAQLLQLDADGRAAVEVVPTRAEWPQLDVAVAAAGDDHQVRIPLLLHREPEVRVDLPDTAGPGATVPCRVGGIAPGTVVTVAVVDERVFAIAADRTPDPDAALRPEVPGPDWRRGASNAPLPPRDVLGTLLEDGRVPGPDLRGELGPATPATGGPAAAAPAESADLREEFRATAAFVTVVAGADGIATAAIELPDDLTTWRVTIVGIGQDGVGFVRRRALATRLPLAAEPLLPRVLREGDRVELPIAVDRATKLDGAGEVSVAVVSESAALQVENGERPLAVAPGTVGTVHVGLIGAAAGDAALAVTAGLGDARDRSRRRLAVQRDAVLRPVAVAALGAGRVEVAAPAGLDPAGELQVTVLGGAGATWREIERQLTVYPYGCAEQTLSRLLPFFAAVRGARAHRSPPPQHSEAFENRLAAGMRRLRELQLQRGGAFAFWPGGEVDARITTLVLHGLAIVREGGVEPARYRLSCDPAVEPFASACARIVVTPRLASIDDVIAAELAGACLRNVPTAAAPRAGVAAVVDAGVSSPRGLLARLGLALHAAGDRDRAAACLQRLATDAASAPDLVDAWPGEDPLAVQSLHLELAIALGVDPGGLPIAVLQQSLHGAASTHAQACALSALALALPPEADGPCTVRVRAGDVEREVELDAGCGHTVTLRLPHAERVVATGPDGRRLLLRVVGERVEPGSTHASWQAPLTVERALCRRRADATAEERAMGRDLEPLADVALARGEPVWLRLRVRSSEPLRYVVVECPLPAGFEPVETPRWLERFDDRIAFAIDRLGTTTVERVVALQPTLAGRVTWPPATAAPMYLAGKDGGTAGAVLEVAPGPEAGGAAAAPAVVRCFAGPSPEAPRLARIPSTPVQVVLEAFERDGSEGIDGPAARAAVDAAFAELRATSAGRDPEDVVEASTQLVRDLRLASAELRGTPTSLQLELLGRAAALHRDVVRDLLQGFETGDGGRYPDHGFRVLADSIAALERDATATALVQRLLRRALVLRVPLGRREIEALGEDALASPVVHGELAQLLPECDAAAREALLDALPDHALAAVPPALLVLWMDESWHEALVRVLLRSSAGRDELRRCLQRPAFVARYAEELLRDLPDELWTAMPLAGFAELIAKVDSGVLDGLAARIATAPIATGTLQRTLVTTDDPDLQYAIALALRRREVRDLGDHVPLPAARGGAVDLWHWDRALAVDEHDPAAAARFLAERGQDPLSTTLRRQIAFVLPILVAHGDAAQLLPLLDRCDEATCRVVFARLDAAGRRRLLRESEAVIEWLPAASDAADCAALWAYAQRLDELPSVLDALARSAVGKAWVEGRIAADPAAADASGLQADWADELGLDPDTLQAPADAPWRPLLLRVARGGSVAALTPAERRILDRVRALRGVH